MNPDGLFSRWWNKRGSKNIRETTRKRYAHLLATGSRRRTIQEYVRGPLPPNWRWLNRKGLREPTQEDGNENKGLKALEKLF